METRSLPFFFVRARSHDFLGGDPFSRKKRSLAEMGFTLPAAAAVAVPVAVPVALALAGWLLFFFGRRKLHTRVFVDVIHFLAEQVEDKAGRVLGGGVANRYEGRLNMIKVHVQCGSCLRAFPTFWHV